MQITWFGIFILLMLVGVFRLYDGKKKLQAEAVCDDRWHKIPDEDVAAYGKLLRLLNKKFGKFYIYYGVFLVITSAFNTIAMLLLKTLDFSLIPIYAWLFGIVVGFFIIGDRNRNFNIQSPIRLPTRIKISFDFLTEMHFLHNAYAQHQFTPQKEWVETAQKTPDLPERLRLVQEAKDLPIPINWYMKNIFSYVIGAAVYYFSVIAIVIYITSMFLLGFF